MGLFPDPDSLHTPRLRRRTFSSNFTRRNDNKRDKNTGADSYESGDLILSTSWEFLRCQTGSRQSQILEQQTTTTIGCSSKPPSGNDHKENAIVSDQSTHRNSNNCQPKYIDVKNGKIVLEPQIPVERDKVWNTNRKIGAASSLDYNKTISSCPTSPTRHYALPFTGDACRNTGMLEARINELEGALIRLQNRVHHSQCSSPTTDQEIKDYLENINKLMITKDKKTHQVWRDHRHLQVNFQQLQRENKTLHVKIKQYESCLDDVMRKVVDALVAEDSLREEVSMLKTRVKDLEAQNALLSASPARGDEGYCTMSSGPPPPGHLEDLPEEPEWLLAAEPCAADMVDWNMSQEELAIALDEETAVNTLKWKSSNSLGTSEIQTENINALLQEKIIYSDDEEILCKNFTRDFYRLVSFKTENNQSPISFEYLSSSDDENEKLLSPTPSIDAQIFNESCSSDNTSDTCNTSSNEFKLSPKNNSTTSQSIAPTEDLCCGQNQKAESGKKLMSSGKPWRLSSGWRRVSDINTESKIPCFVGNQKSPTTPIKSTFA